jgi:hypothetical protein
MIPPLNISCMPHVKQLHSLLAAKAYLRKVFNVWGVVLSLSMSCAHYQGTGCFLSAATYFTEYGKEYLGGDLNTPAAACANQTTLCQCAELCAETDICHMFTWTHPSSTTCPGGCRLKGAVRMTHLHGGTYNYEVTTGLLLRGRCSPGFFPGFPSLHRWLYDVIWEVSGVQDGMRLNDANHTIVPLLRPPKRQQPEDRGRGETQE